MKTLLVEKARENYEKAKERAEVLQAKTAAAVKHLSKCEADLIEAENAEYIRIVREMNLSIAELRQIRKERKPLDALKENKNEEETRKNESLKVRRPRHRAERQRPEVLPLPAGR